MGKDMVVVLASNFGRIWQDMVSINEGARRGRKKEEQACLRSGKRTQLWHWPNTTSDHIKPDC